MRECAHCQQPIPSERSGKAKYCTSKCSRTANRDTAKPCTEGECAKNVRARGLCAAHYNQQYAASRHSKTMAPCFICDKPALKFATNNKARAAVCSAGCRRTLTFGTPLPEDHWVRWYGKASAWTAPKPTTVPKMARECEWCGEGYETHQSLSRFCTERCSSKASKLRRRAREHGSTGMYSWAEVMRLFMAADKMCAYCDERIDGQPDPDHVTPLSRGGRNDMDNIVACCRSCNADKCDMTLDEWAIERMRLGKRPVRYVLDFTNPRFKHLTLDPATGTAWRHSLAA